MSEALAMDAVRTLTIIALIAFAGTSTAQDSAPRRMTQERLHAILAEGNVAVFRLGETQLLRVSDEFADRLRIIAPVKRLDEATPEELLAALHANFHTVLDARYAVSNGVIFVAYLHPLSSLTKDQIVAAMHQVAAARASFGTDYSGGGPAFGGVR
jgi:hypothetical protein